MYPVSAPVSTKVHTAGVAATPSDAIATGVGAGSDRLLAIICTQAFNLTFADSPTAITNPADNSAFAAGVLYVFRLGPKNTHYKFTPAANCVMTHFKASRE